MTSDTYLYDTSQFKHVTPFYHYCNSIKNMCIFEKCKGKGKVVPLQAWSGSEVSRKLRFPDFMTMAQEDGKAVSLTHRLHLPAGNPPGTHFC